MPDRIRAVLDTNVILSAILFGGTPLQALDAWRLQGLFNLVISPEILAEVLGKLEAKFNFPPYLIQEWQWLLSRNVIRALPVQRIEACRDPSDNKFLETSVAASARFLVTGDRDLLDLGAYEDIRIVTPREFLAHLGLS